MPTPTIRYTVAMPRPATHLLNVSVEIDGPGDAVELRFPVWTPGSYMVREFARHVQGFRAEAGGNPLRWTKTRKDSWRIECEGAPTVAVSYDVYANDLTVRTSHLDATHAFFNPANLLPYTPARAREPLLLTVRAPMGWTVATGLARADRAGTVFLASDYDELVDCPVHVGPDPVLEFQACGAPHCVATWGRSNLDPARLLADLTRIVETEAAIFGGVPYRDYLFILMATSGGRGGLEHRNSSANMVPRFSFRPGRTYERVLSLLAHEHFHTWNVKRIHPMWNGGAYDYGIENYTRLLWAMEGITEYYSSLTLRRAGLITPERYLEILADQMRDLAETPGRALQSLEEASFDAWIKYYRPDEHSANSSVSYYLKGALVSLLLDLEIRERTSGARSLDDLMRLLWERYGMPDRGVPEDAYQALVREVAGGDWSAFFDRYVRGREELDLAPALRSVGIEIETKRDANAPEAWLGIRTRTESGRLKIAAIPSSGPAWESELSAGDEILAVDGFRVDDASLADRLRDYRPGDTATVAAFHGDQLIEVPIVLGTAPATRFTLKKIARPTVRQREAYASWIAAPWK
ncbi:MAG TPA: PDZ domain-containing protein [Chloroflexota bacterium]|nr:PDZ domain-containing protein [Chloroflexota bacterium]